MMLWLIIVNGLERSYPLFVYECGVPWSQLTRVFVIAPCFLGQIHVKTQYKKTTQGYLAPLYRRSEVVFDWLLYSSAPHCFDTVLRAILSLEVKQPTIYLFLYYY